MTGELTGSDRIDLSGLKVLRSLQAQGWVGDSGPRGQRSVVVKEVFLTVKSPVFSEFVIVFGGDTVKHLPDDVELFEALREMNQARPFELVFSFRVPRANRAEVRLEFAGALELMIARGLFDFLESPPTIR